MKQIRFSKFIQIMTNKGTTLRSCEAKTLEMLDLKSLLSLNSTNFSK